MFLVVIGEWLVTSSHPVVQVDQVAAVAGDRSFDPRGPQSALLAVGPNHDEPVGRLGVAGRNARYRDVRLTGATPVERASRPGLVLASGSFCTSLSDLSADTLWLGLGWFVEGEGGCHHGGVRSIHGTYRQG
jgi:hypothetical protein